jgi:hypothetical protein
MLDEGALASGVVALLEARREGELAEVVGRSSIELGGRAEQWAMGSREVTAYRVALVVSAEDHARLTSKPERLEALKDAFAAAVHTHETELESLTLVLALPPSGFGFHHAYRDAPARAPEPPSSEAVLGGAAALSAAAGDKVGAEILGRAGLEDAFVEGAARPLRRFVLRLDPADFGRAQRDGALGDRLSRAVREAATTAADMTVAVHLGLRSYGAPPAPEGPEASLMRALERKGAVVVPVARDDEKTVLVVVMAGGVVMVELVGRRGAKLGSAEVQLGRLTLPKHELDDPSTVEDITNRLIGSLAAGSRMRFH